MKDFKGVAIIIILLFTVFILTGCDSCYFQDGQNIQVKGKILKTGINTFQNETCSKEVNWVVVETKQGCTLNVLSYDYDTCKDSGKRTFDCIGKNLINIDVKGIYGKIKMQGDYGETYYEVTPYACAE